MIYNPLGNMQPLQDDIYTRQYAAIARWHLYHHLGRRTILRLRHIVLFFYCPSCT